MASEAPEVLGSILGEQTWSRHLCAWSHAYLELPALSPWTHTQVIWCKEARQLALEASIQYEEAALST